MIRLAALLLMGLAVACVPAAPEREVSLIWNPTATMSATSRFDVARFGGNWVRRSGYGTVWRFDALKVLPPKAGTAGNWLETGGSEPRAAFVVAPAVGQMILQYGGDVPQQMRVVVLWVDEGFRTAVIAARDGSDAMILDRSAKGGADRIKAARSLLQRNGFTLSLMKQNPA